MKKIEYVIDKQGNVTEHVLEGFSGTECESETASIEQALGYVTDRKRKEDGEGQYRAPTVYQGNA